MTQHRFISDDRSPEEYTCVCGKRGTYALIEYHIAAENLPICASESDAAPTAPYEHVIDNDFGEEGGTKAHYLPIEPRRPAPTGEAPPLNSPPPPSILSTVDDCPLCGIDKRPRSIAESFQDMLRTAFQAGATATTTGESFETWYHREVLR